MAFKSAFNSYGLEAFQIVYIFTCLMLPSPNLFQGLCFWLNILTQERSELSYMHGSFRRQLDTYKTTIYAPLGPTTKKHFSPPFSAFSLEEHLISINLVLYYILNPDDLNNWGENLVFHWSLKCDRFSAHYTVPINWTGRTFRTDADQRRLGIARLRIYLTTHQIHKMLHISISTPVSIDLVGLNVFRLARKNGSNLLSSSKIVFKAPDDGKALPRSFKFCNGDPKLCYAFILPNFNNKSKSYICRRISSANLKLPSKSNKTSTDLPTDDGLVSSVLIISSIAVLSCVGAVAFALNLTSIVRNYSVRRSDAFYL